MNEFFLLIDDKRVYHNVEHTARTASDGRKALLGHPVTHLLLDNDLGPGQDEGHQILSWALDRGCLPKKVLLVTSNTVAKERMNNMLSDHNYVYRPRTGWWIRV